MLRSVTMDVNCEMVSYMSCPFLSLPLPLSFPASPIPRLPTPHTHFPLVPPFNRGFLAKLHSSLENLQRLVLHNGAHSDMAADQVSIPSIALSQAKKCIHTPLKLSEAQLASLPSSSSSCAGVQRRVQITQRDAQCAYRGKDVA